MKYPKLVLEERINGIDVNLVGVTHLRNFFHKHENFFREQICRSPAIFSEDGPEGFTDGFSEEIAKVAQETGKPIYILESGSNIHSFLGLAQLGIGGYLAGSYLRKSDDMSRRTFLKKGVSTLLGSYLMGSCLTQNSIIQKVIGNENVKLDDALQYDAIIDYRNIVAAENIDRASKVLQLEGKIPYFIGSLHVKGIHAYLRNPGLRKKRLLYFPQDLISDTSIRKYEFKENNWKLTERI